MIPMGKISTVNVRDKMDLIAIGFGIVEMSPQKQNRSIAS